MTAPQPPERCHVCGAAYDFTVMGNARYQCGMIFHVNTGPWVGGCRNIYAVLAAHREREQALVAALEAASDMLDCYISEGVIMALYSDDGNDAVTADDVLEQIHTALAAAEPADTEGQEHAKK